MDDLTTPDPPEAAQPPARRKPPAGVAASLRRLEVDLGGRPALVAALSHAPKSKDADYVLGLIGDPTFKAISLAEICAMGGITAGELLEAYKAGVMARAHALSAKDIAEQLPGVVSDTLRLAQPHKDTCHACQGTCSITPDPTKDKPNPAPEPCPLCGATGELVYAGDLDHKKLALELGRLTSKGGGISVSVDARQAHLHSSGEAAGGTLEQLQLATDRILYGGHQPGLGPRGDLLLPSAAAAIDAELLEAASDGESPDDDPDPPAAPGQPAG